MNMRYSAIDWIISCLLTVILLVCGGMIINAGHDLGDDFAAYINEGIAIAQGRLEEQDRLNLIMHPTPMTYADENMESLTYVWGYPLVLSIIYRLFGFDTQTYATVIYYKLPVVMCLALLGGVLYLYYCRRFHRLTAMCLALLFCLVPSFIQEVQHISPDIPFLFLSMLAFWLMECARDEERMLFRCIIYVALGMVLWALYVTRLNGFTIVLICAFGQAMAIFKQKEYSSRKWIAELIPYAICFGMLTISYACLPKPTSNLSDVGASGNTMVVSNLFEIIRMLRVWLYTVFSRSSKVWLDNSVSGPFMLLAAVLGMIKCNWRKDLHILLYVVISPVVLALLPYGTTQGLRYLYSILPFVLMYAACGVRHIVRWIVLHADEPLKRAAIWAARVALVILMLGVGMETASNTAASLSARGHDLVESDSYSTFAVDMYRYIQQETTEDSVICYFKPRSLYLNTGRLAYKPRLAPENVYSDWTFLPKKADEWSLKEADYLLLYCDDDLKQYQALLAEPENKVDLIKIYANQQFTMYQVLQHNTEQY